MDSNSTREQTLAEGFMDDVGRPMDCTGVCKEVNKHFLDNFWLFIAVFTPLYLLSGTL